MNASSAAAKTQALQALGHGEIGKALRLWEEITTGDSSPADLLEHASLLHQLYRSCEAAPLWERLLAHPGATVEQWLAAGKLWFQAGRFTGSARFTAKALETQPDSPDIAAMHASALERGGSRQQAEDLAREMLERHPAHSRLARLLAHLERRDGHFEQAKERLERHLRDHPSPDDWRLRYELAAVLDRLDEPAGAIKELERAKLQIEPDTAALRPAWRAMTARQWELAQALSAERLARWADGDETRERLCLMAGFPRSGTTLLERILSVHPGCIGTDESGVLSTQFRDPIVFNAGSTHEVLTELDGYDADGLAAGRAEYLRCTADVLGEDPGDRLLIEKDPLLTADLALPLRLFPKSKLLMPLRDPRDVAISFYFTIVPLAPNSVAASSLGETCRYYAEVMRHWLLLRERLPPSRWMESRYEDLLDAPESRTRQLAAFLDLDWRAEMLAHHRQPAGRAVGTPTYDDVSKPLYRRSLERWRRYEAWLEPHLRHLAPYLRAFGYED